MNILSLLKRSTKSHPYRRPVPRALLRVESLESRLVPYALSGASWVHPELITLSIVPDGTNLGGATSTLISSFNTKFGSQSTWLSQIAKAAQVWAQQTNLNLQVVTDNGAATGSGANQQGDPGFGDIRIGGFNFGSSALAMAYLPPQTNNYSLAGDMALNTGQTWNIGTTYDLFTVVEHEIGHALGLLHSTVSGTVMWPSYTHVLSLQPDEIAGIRAIYSTGLPRSYDSNGGANNSFSTAADVTGLMDTQANTILVTGRDNTTTAQQEYYTVVVPSGTNGTMTVTVQSAGLSLLSPIMTVYDASQHALGSQGSAGRTSTTLSLTVSGVTAGQRYYVRVKGADSTAFSTGAYGMTFQFSTNAAPAIPTANTTTADGTPLSGGGGIPFNPLNIGVDGAVTSINDALAAAGAGLNEFQWAAISQAFVDAFTASLAGFPLRVVNDTMDSEISAVLSGVLDPVSLATLLDTINSTIDGALQVSTPADKADAIVAVRKSPLNLSTTPLDNSAVPSLDNPLGTSTSTPTTSSTTGSPDPASTNTATSSANGGEFNVDQAGTSDLLSVASQKKTHGNGCNCSLCRRARSARQQITEVESAVSKSNEAPVPVIASPGASNHDDPPADRPSSDLAFPPTNDWTSESGPSSHAAQRDTAEVDAVFADQDWSAAVGVS